MFGKKKRYIKKWDTSETVGGRSQAHSKVSKVNSNNMSRNSARRDDKDSKSKPKSSLFSDLNKLKVQDKTLLEFERLENRAKKRSLEEPLIQKSAFIPLIIFSVFLSLELVKWIFSIKLFKTGSTASVFLIFPALFGTVIIFYLVFHFWKQKLQPVHRVLIRKVFSHWKIIFAVVYLIYARNIINGFS